MNMKEVKDLIQEILQSDISEFELEHTGTKVRLKRGFDADNSHSQASHESVADSPSRKPSSETQSLPSPPEEPLKRQDHGLHLITSPIVGTFYRAPSPEAATYVEVGDKVSKGSTLCVVEAMKLMNEIPSDVSGLIEEAYVDNAHPVEFGQKLFGIRLP